MALACLQAPAAGAAGYDVYSCRGPAGEPLPTTAWEARPNDAQPGDVWVDDDCATGGSLRLEMNPAGIAGQHKARLDLVFDLPRGARVTGYRLLRAIRVTIDQPGYEYAAAIRETGPGGEITDEGCISGGDDVPDTCLPIGDPSVPDAPGNLLERTGLDLTGLSAWIACESIGCTPPATTPPTQLTLFGSRVTIADDDPPEVLELGGSLTDSGPLDGVERLFVQAGDQGGGVTRISLSVDGGQPQEREVAAEGCAVPYSMPQPCPSRTAHLFEVDTAGLAVGPHEASGEVVDAAGNVASFGPLPFEVARPSGPPDPPDPPDPPGPAPNGDPADPAASIELSKRPAKGKRGGGLTGRLLTADGRPIAGAALAVSSIDLGDASGAERRHADAVTGPDGSFTVPPAGPGARRVTVAYSAAVGGPVSATASTVVHSRLAIALKATPKRTRKGKPVRFSGRLTGAGRAAKGANVLIQAVSGGEWRTIATVQAKASGKFAWRYRFRFVERPAIFSFRAVVPDNPGWPWDQIKSKRVQVRVNGA